MSARRDHQWRLFRDPHVLTALALTLLLCALSLGGVYAGCFVHVLRTARSAPCAAPGDGCLLLFGKHVRGGVVDPDFRARIERAALVWRAQPQRTLLLLGGGHGGQASEAELARDALLQAGVAADASILLETGSLDTLQNLRNARELLRSRGHAGPVVLLSSRYHLARCALFARGLGLDYALCAAEPRLPLRPSTLWPLAREAAWVCWVGVGMCWARLTGHRAMLARVR